MATVREHERDRRQLPGRPIWLRVLVYARPYVGLVVLTLGLTLLDLIDPLVEVLAHTGEGREGPRGEALGGWRGDAQPLGFREGRQGGGPRRRCVDGLLVARLVPGPRRPLLVHGPR